MDLSRLPLPLHTISTTTYSVSNVGICSSYSQDLTTFKFYPKKVGKKKKKNRKSEKAWSLKVRGKMREK